MTEAHGRQDYEVGLTYQKALDKLRLAWNFTSQMIFYDAHPQVDAPKTEARTLSMLSDEQKAFDKVYADLKANAPKGSYWNDQ